MICPAPAQLSPHASRRRSGGGCLSGLVKPALALWFFPCLWGTATATVSLEGRCQSKFMPKGTHCKGCPPKYNGKLCASTTRYNDQTKGACGCGNTDPVPSDWWTLTQYTAAINCKSLDADHPLKAWCPIGCGQCFELCSTGSTTQGSGTKSDVCKVFKITNRCGDGYNEYPMWCSNTRSWTQCRDHPHLCREMGSTNWYGYPAHFDLQDFHQQISGGLGWDNVEVTFEKVSCSRWHGPDWDCMCNSSSSSPQEPEPVSPGAMSGSFLPPVPPLTAAPQPATLPPIFRTSTPAPGYGTPFPVATVPMQWPPLAATAAPVWTPSWSTWAPSALVPASAPVVASTTTALSWMWKPSPTPAPTFAPPPTEPASSSTATSTTEASTATSTTTETRRAREETTKKPVASAGYSFSCSADGEQCGGSDWSGPFCCNTGCACLPVYATKYVCTPQTPGEKCTTDRPVTSTTERWVEAERWPHAASSGEGGWHSPEVAEMSAADAQEAAEAAAAAPPPGMDPEAVSAVEPQEAEAAVEPGPQDLLGGGGGVQFQASSQGVAVDRYIQDDELEARVKDAGHAGLSTARFLMCLLPVSGFILVLACGTLLRRMRPSWVQQEQRTLVYDTVPIEESVRSTRAKCEPLVR